MPWPNQFEKTFAGHSVEKRIAALDWEAAGNSLPDRISNRPPLPTGLRAQLWFDTV